MENFLKNANLTHQDLNAFLKAQQEQQMNQNMTAPPQYNNPGGEIEKVRPVKVAPKVGRNDPCPCGSGKKYKKCCGMYDTE
jgi:preprotein translocase subunit SecA